MRFECEAAAAAIRAKTLIYAHRLWVIAIDRKGLKNKQEMCEYDNDVGGGTPEGRPGAEHTQNRTRPTLNPGS